jgi:hypothetical protein
MINLYAFSFFILIIFLQRAVEAGGLGLDCESLYPLPEDVDNCRIFTWQQQASKEDKTEKVEIQTDKEEDKSEKEGMENVAQKAGPIFDLNEPHPPSPEELQVSCRSLYKRMTHPPKTLNADPDPSYSKSRLWCIKLHTHKYPKFLR